MKTVTTTIAIMTAAGLAFAQLLPQKPAEEAKLDRALIFKVDYSAEVSPDSSSLNSSSPMTGEHKKGDFLKNSLVWTGLCITGAALSAAFNGNGPIWCDPNSTVRF